MPITTLNPTVNTTPDQAGTSAVTGITNNGHAATLASCSASDFESQPADNQSQNKSARWSSFQAGPGGLIGLKLKFTWSITGSVEVLQNLAGTGSASISYRIEYTVDGGSNWTASIVRSTSVGINDSATLDDGGSVSIDLSPSQTISLVQVRDKNSSSASANAPSSPSNSEVESTAGITSTISGIVLEAETPNTGNAGVKFLIGT